MLELCFGLTGNGEIVEKTVQVIESFDSISVH